MTWWLKKNNIPQRRPVDRDDIAMQVMVDIGNRRRIGISKYGKTVQVPSQYDMLWEAYEECLDQAIYLRAAIEQAKDNDINGEHERRISESHDCTGQS